MIIRTATKTDKIAILNLLDEFRSDCIEQITDKKGFSNTAINGGTKLFDKALENENYYISVLVNDENDIIGIITGYTCPMLRSGEYRAEVEEFFIKNKYRGSGNANKLMDSFFTWCKSKNVSKVNLESDNQLKRAHSFYMKYGFETKAQRFIKKIV